MKTLVSVLLAVCIVNASVAKPTITPVPPPTSNPDIVAEIGVGLGIIAAGCVIIFGLHKISALLGPPPPPAPPIQVPIIPPIIILDLKTAPQTTTAPMTFCFDDSGVTEYNIASSNWNDPNGYQYVAYFKTTIQSSQDLRTWTNECSVIGYVSIKNVLTIWYDELGNPFSTNYCCNTNSATCSYPIDTTPSRKFFRTVASL